MSAPGLRRNSPADIAAFVDAVEAFAATLPAHVSPRFERQGEHFELSFEAATPAHRCLSLMSEPAGLDYQLGKLWSEMEPVETDLTQLLATLDAVRDGRVREITDRRTGVLYHVYQLRSRGLRKTLKDSDFSLWHWLHLPIRRVRIHRIPAVGAV